MADCEITDKWSYRTGASSGAITGIQNAVIQAIPARNDMRFTDSGGVYRITGINPNITTAAYDDGIRVVTDANGQYTMFLPRADASKPTSPSPQWTIIFPDGKMVYGTVPNVAGPLIIDDLISTHSWVFTSSAYVAPVTPGTLARGSVTFTAVDNMPVVFATTFASAAYNIKLSASRDDSTNNVPTVGWDAKTTTGFTIYTTGIFTGTVDFECVL